MYSCSSFDQSLHFINNFLPSFHSFSSILGFFLLINLIYLQSVERCSSSHFLTEVYICVFIINFSLLQPVSFSSPPKSGPMSYTLGHPGQCPHHPPTNHTQPTIHTVPVSQQLNQALLWWGAAELIASLLSCSSVFSLLSFEELVRYLSVVFCFYIFFFFLSLM